MFNNTEKTSYFSTTNKQKNAGKVEVFIHIIFLTCYNKYVENIIINKPPTLIEFLVGSPAKVICQLKTGCGRVYFFVFFCNFNKVIFLYMSYCITIIMRYQSLM
ncbi:hypothetical protein D0437_30940 [Bacillus cereus]|uniref:Uncharacterized protein n=1 Tax=Bacillus cereus TaxID=1396 RepID=A0A9X7QNN1_BACCE|nr:hypothetical protein D0437_30940 [Bacillus cereus]